MKPKKHLEDFKSLKLNYKYFIRLCPNNGHADLPPQKKGSPQKSGYEWCGVFCIEREK